MMGYINKRKIIGIIANEWFGIETCNVDDIIAFIENIPDEPIDGYEEIKHGHWYGVNHYQDYAHGQCSECKESGRLRTSRDSWGIWYIDMPRCPKCGAIMDGKKNYL